MEDGELGLWEGIFGPRMSGHYLDRLASEIPWQQATITIYGRRVTSPRLTAWYGERPYTYSNLTWPPAPLPTAVREIKDRVEALSGHDFNGVLLNLYRDGRDSMGWHSDDERGLGPAPVVASVSFGATRRFQLRRKDDHRKKREIPLAHDSLLVMGGDLQAHWQHAVPKSTKSVAPRINLTFRHVAS